MMLHGEHMTQWQRNLCAIYDFPPWIIASDHCTWRDRLWWYRHKWGLTRFHWQQRQARKRAKAAQAYNGESV
jgi:hypothetical protein